jgi:ribosome-associated protein
MEGDFVAKSGKSRSTGSADGKGTDKEQARLEKRLQKALNLEAKRRKQVSEATAGVKDLRAQLIALGGGRRAAPSKAVAKAPVRASAKAPAKAPAKSAPARTAATSSTSKTTPRGAGANTTATRRSSGTATAARRTTRTRRPSSAEGTGDGTGPA